MILRDKRPLVSVLITNYNHEKFLENRLNSVFSQTFNDYELVIIDDSSSDGSAQIIEKYRENPYVKNIVYQSENLGSPFKLWLFALPYLRGEYVWIAESDDYADPKFLETCVSYLKTNKAHFVHTDSWVVDGSNICKYRYSEKKNAYFQTSLWSENQYISGRRFLNDYFLFDNVVNNVSSAVFNKSFLEQIDNEKLVRFKNVGDYYFFLEIVKKASYHYISEPLNYFRIHENNFTQKNYESGLLGVEVYYMLKDYFVTLKSLDNEYLEVNYGHTYYAMLKYGKMCLFSSIRSGWKELNSLKRLGLLSFWEAGSFLMYLIWEVKNLKGLGFFKKRIFKHPKYWVSHKL